MLLNQQTLYSLEDKLNKPTIIIEHNKTLVAKLYGEFKEFFPENAVEYFVSFHCLLFDNN